MKRMILMGLLLAIATICAAKALEPERPDWVSMNPFFDNAGRWYTR